eukprot:768619-Hanusia_phi.AAC.5
MRSTGEGPVSEGDPGAEGAELNLKSRVFVDRPCHPKDPTYPKHRNTTVHGHHRHVSNVEHATRLRLSPCGTVPAGRPPGRHDARQLRVGTAIPESPHRDFHDSHFRILTVSPEDSETRGAAFVINRDR